MVTLEKETEKKNISKVDKFHFVVFWLISHGAIGTCQCFKDSCQKILYVPPKYCSSPARLHDDRMVQRITKHMIITVAAGPWLRR